MSNRTREYDAVEVPVLQLRCLNGLGENEPDRRRRNVVHLRTVAEHA